MCKYSRELSSGVTTGSGRTTTLLYCMGGFVLYIGNVSCVFCLFNEPMVTLANALIGQICLLFYPKMKICIWKQKITAFAKNTLKNFKQKVIIKTIWGKFQWQALTTLRAYPFSTGAYSLDTHTIIVVPEKTLFGAHHSQLRSPQRLIHMVRKQLISPFLGHT